MNLLDENVRDDQRALLQSWRIPFRQIGREISRTGIQDPDVLPLLHRLKQPTLFTQDQDFFKFEFCHRDYCLVWLDVQNTLVANYIRRVLTHPLFNTRARRMRKVIHVRTTHLRFWQLGDREMHRVAWEDKSAAKLR